MVNYKLINTILIETPFNLFFYVLNYPSANLTNKIFYLRMFVRKRLEGRKSPCIREGKEVREGYNLKNKCTA